MYNFKKKLNLNFRLVKIMDIGYIALIYFFLAILLSSLMDKVYGPYDQAKEKEKLFYVRALELVGMIWLNGVIIYFVRNLVPFIPSPFDNIYGFKHIRLKELKSAGIFEFVFLIKQDNLLKRIKLFYDTVKTYLF